MDAFGEVFFCLNCGDPIQHPLSGGLKTENIAYPEGLREVLVTLKGREVHGCSFVTAPVESESSDQPGTSDGR